MNHTHEPRDPPDRHAAPGSVALSVLLKQASAELQAEPMPPLDKRALAALPVARGRSHPPSVVVSDAPGTRRQGRGWPIWSTVAAACGLLLVAATTLVMLAPPPDADANGVWTQAGFTPLVDAERWHRLSREEGAAWVVNAELPQGQLAGFGMPFDPERAAEPVRAELLMRASGELLAVRVLR